MKKEIAIKKIARRHLKKISAFYGGTWPHAHPPLTTPQPFHLLEGEKESLEDYAQDVARVIERTHRGFEVKVGAYQEGSDKITLTALTPYGLRFSMSYKVIATRSELKHTLIFYVSKVQRNMNTRLKWEVDIPLHDDFGRGARANFIEAGSHEGVLRELSSVSNVLRFLPRER